MNITHHPEELDLVLPEMNSQSAERNAQRALDGLPGLLSVRLVPRGAFIRYDPWEINKDQICNALRHADFRASTFQDSKSGKTGHSNH